MRLWVYLNLGKFEKTRNEKNKRKSLKVKLFGLRKKKVKKCREINRKFVRVRKLFDC